MKKFYLIFAAAVIAAVLCGCPNGIERSTNNETTISGGSNSSGNNSDDSSSSSSDSNSGSNSQSDIDESKFTAVITAFPKTEYIENETFSLDGLCVTIYDDAGYTMQELSHTDTTFDYTAPNMAEKGTQNVVLTFQYQNKPYSVTLPISINLPQYYGRIHEDAPFFSSIYLPGEEFSLLWLVYDICDRSSDYVMEGNSFTWKGTVSQQKYPGFLEYDDPDMTKLGTQNVYIKYKFESYPEKWVYITLPIKVISPDDAYIITYTGKGTTFSAELVKDNLVRIRVADSVTDLDIMDYYALKKAVIEAGAGRVIYDDIPKSVVYHLDVPDEPTDLSMGDSASGHTAWTRKNQQEIIIDFFIDYTRQHGFYEIDECKGEYHHLRPLDFLNSMRDYTNMVLYDYESEKVYGIRDDMVILEYIPGINFVLASGLQVSDSMTMFHGDMYAYSIQVESGRTLSLSGEINIHSQWMEYSEFSVIAGTTDEYEPIYQDLVYRWHSDFKGLFWLEEGASLRVDDWNKLKLVGYDYCYNGGDGAVSNLDVDYAVKLLGLDIDSITSADQLPVIDITGLWGVEMFGINDDEFKQGSYRGKESYSGSGINWVINCSLIGKIIEKYHQLGALSKIDVFGRYYVDGYRTPDYPSIYTGNGNEVNPDCPKLPAGLLAWYAAHSDDRCENIRNWCVVDDGTKIDFDKVQQSQIDRIVEYELSMHSNPNDFWSNELGQAIQDKESFGVFLPAFNIRYEIDLSDVKFVDMYTTGYGYIGTHAVGVLDIAGPAPQNLPEGNGLPVVIVRKEAVKDGHRACLDAVAYGYDLRDLSADEVSRAPAGMALWILYSADGYPANPAVNEYVDGDVNFTKPSIKEIEQGARDGKTPGQVAEEHNNH